MILLNMKEHKVGNMLKLSYREDSRQTAILSLQERRARQISPLAPAMVYVTHDREPDYLCVADFIKTVYRQSYDARIEVSYPVLMNVRNAKGDILCAVGVRYAAGGPLFLENYTKTALDVILGCARRHIAEIGNLASGGQGASVFLFAALAAYLDHQGIRHAAITGTDFLHRYFERSGLEPRRICDADIKSVRDGGQDWGSYYDRQPRVLVGSVRTGFDRLKLMLGAEFESLPWPGVPLDIASGADASLCWETKANA